MLLLLDEDSRTWERVGFATLNEDVKNPFVRKSNFSPWLDADFELLSSASADTTTLKAKFGTNPDYFAEPGRWWRRHFEPEVVTLA